MPKPRNGMPDYYKALQVDPSADPEIIKAAFAKLALKYHPDINKSHDAHERMIQINEARDCLCDPEKRAEYDRKRQEEEGERPHHADPANPPIPIVRPTVLHFGELREREVVSKRLTVDNTGGRASELNFDLANGTGPFRIVDAHRISDAAAFPMVVTVEASASGLAAGQAYSDYLQIDLDGVTVQAVLEVKVREIVSEPPRPRHVSPPPVPSASPPSSILSPRSAHRGWIVFWAVILFVIISVLISNIRSGPPAGAMFAPHGAGTLVDELANASAGNAYGISWTNAIGSHGAVFRAGDDSRIEYPGRIPREGTIEIWIKVDSGYLYENYDLKENMDTAMVFSTDAEGGDVTWPGTTKLYVSRNGNVLLFIANNKYNQPPTTPLEAQGTPFRFGGWHAIGFSLGSSGQYIMVDGKVVAANPSRTQQMGCSGTHVSPADIPTIGETTSHYWQHHQHEGGFEGMVAMFRATPKQLDWDLARGITTISPAVNPSQTQLDDQLAVRSLKEAQTLFEQRQYSEALARCKTVLERDPKNSQAAELKNRIEKAVEILQRPPLPVTALQPQGDDQINAQLLKQAQVLFENRQYTEALAQCNTLIERDPNNLQALELRQRIQKAISILNP